MRACPPAPARRPLLMVAMMACGLAAGPASAQSVPYMRDLLRLSEIMGALHHLRPLCGADEQRLWRDKMAALIAAENPGAEMRQRMVGRFNRNYRELSDIHKTCTPAAQEIISRYVAEGAKITEELVGKYGNSP